MSVTLSALADRLERAVPARNGAPADYEALCQDAVQQLAQDAPILTATAIAVAAGVASYPLPADFLYLVELAGAPQAGSVLLADNGIVPFADGWQESTYIEGDTLRLDPTPAYTVTRTLRYAAGYTLVSGQYPRLTENGARVALLYAQHLALAEQANAQAGDGWSYKIGDESVDKRGLAASIQAQAAAALTNYQNALRPLKGFGTSYRASQWAGVEV